MIRQKVVVVCGDSNERAWLKGHLESLGADVALFSDAKKVLDKELAYDVALVDYLLPDLCGLDLIGKLRERNPSARHILMASHTPSAQVLKKALESGAQDFLVKPLTKDQLESTLYQNTFQSHLYDSLSIYEQLSKKLVEKVEDLTMFYTISEAFGGVETEERLFEYLAELTAKVTNADSAVFYLVDVEQNRLFLKSAWNLDQLPCVNSDIEVNPSILNNVIASPNPLMLKSSKPIRFCNFKHAPCKFCAMLGAPLYVRDELFGIVVARRTEHKEFDQKAKPYMASLLKKAALAIENSALYESLYITLLNTLRSLVTTIEAKDSYTQQHSLRVTHYALAIAKNLDCSPTDTEAIKFAASLHDIGKIGVSDVVLRKPGKLSFEEFEEIKKHPLVGERILEPLSLGPSERAIIRNHHESWNGRGYPDGLAGRQIPFLARIVTLADAFDAMTSFRPYRRAMHTQIAIKELIKYSDDQFDGRIVKAFLDLYLDGKVDKIMNATEQELVQFA